MTDAQKIVVDVMNRLPNEKQMQLFNYAMFLLHKYEIDESTDFQCECGSSNFRSWISSLKLNIYECQDCLKRYER